MSYHDRRPVSWWARFGKLKVGAVRFRCTPCSYECRPLLDHLGVRMSGSLARLEAVRLELLALFRALDRMDLAPAEIPQLLLRQLFELDADYAEALWVLDQTPGRFNLRATLRDTSAALEGMPQLGRSFAACFRHVLNRLYQHSSAPFVRV